MAEQKGAVRPQLAGRSNSPSGAQACAGLVGREHPTARRSSRRARRKPGQVSCQVTSPEEALPGHAQHVGERVDASDAVQPARIWTRAAPGRSTGTIEEKIQRLGDGHGSLGAEAVHEAEPEPAADRWRCRGPRRRARRGPSGPPCSRAPQQRSPRARTSVDGESARVPCECSSGPRMSVMRRHGASSSDRRSRSRGRATRAEAERRRRRTPSPGCAASGDHPVDMLSVGKPGEVVTR